MGWPWNLYFLSIFYLRTNQICFTHTFIFSISPRIDKMKRKRLMSIPDIPYNRFVLFLPVYNHTCRDGSRIFIYGGGGGCAKKLCARTHITSAEPNSLSAGVQGPLNPNKTGGGGWWPPSTFRAITLQSAKLSPRHFMTIFFRVSRTFWHQNGSEVT